MQDMNFLDRYGSLPDGIKAAMRSMLRDDVDMSRVSLEHFHRAFMSMCRDEYLMYNPHDKQRLFHQAGKFAKQRMFLAGNRTGKTLGACTEIAMHLTGVYPDWWLGYRYNRPVNVWVASKSSALVRDALQAYYFEGVRAMSLIGDERILRKTKKQGVPGAYDQVFIKHISGDTSVLTFKSYDQGRENFQAAGLDIIHLDEEPDYDIYTECLTRLMTTSKNHHGMMLLTMTPLMGYTDLVQRFLELPCEDMVDGKWWISATWQDNPHLNSQEQQEMIASYLPHELEARTKGIPSLGSGKVYPVLEEELLIKPFEIPDHWPRVFGMDFGWTNPTAVVCAAHDRDNDVVYLYGEYGATERTPQEHAQQMLSLGCDWMPGVCDPASRNASQIDGQKMMDLYRNSGIRHLYPADNSKEIGIAKVLSRMQNGKLKIVNTMSKTMAELRSYARDEDGLPKKKNDHFMDAMRYLVMSGLGVATTKKAREMLRHNAAHASKYALYS